MSSANPVLASVQGSFNSLDTKGDRHVLKGGPSYAALSESHLQGIALYGNYYLICQNRHDHSEGKLYFFGVDDNKFVTSMHLPTSSAADGHDHDYNHPGGMQVIGDYLVIPLQTQDYSKSKVQLWDLTPLKSGSCEIKPISYDFLPDSNDKRVGAIGMASLASGFLIAACNNSKVHFYQSSGTDIRTARFDYLFSSEMEHSASETCLLTDASGVYLISFWIKDRAGEYSDHASLYSVDLQSGAPQMTLLQSTHFITRHDALGLFGVHFRWGSGIYFPGGNSLGLLATQRVMDDTCDINTFEVAPQG